jgi:hypothetical protein
VRRALSITLDGRPKPWTLAIEPWALAFEIAAEQNAKIEIFNPPANDDPDINVGHDGETFAFFDPIFSVTIGDVVEHFDFSYLDHTP